MSKKLCRTKQLEQDYNISIERHNYDGYLVYEYYSNLDKTDDLYICEIGGWLETLDEVEENIKEELDDILDYILNMKELLKEEFYSEEEQKKLLERFYSTYPRMKKQEVTNNE